MKMSKIKKVISGTVSALMIVSSVPTVVSAADQQTRGNIGGFDYEMWNQNGQGQVSMNPGAGSFSCSWSNIENFLARMGKNYDSQKKNYKAFGDITLSYDVEYTPRGNSYMCVYGWTRNPLMEYYIVEGWGDWRPPGNDGERKGTVTLDGHTYDIAKTMRYNQPSLDGTATFPQYWSIRQQSGSANNQTNYMKGTISVSKHFDAWSQAGLDMSGTLYEVSLNIEGYRSNGSANVKSISFDGSPNPQPSTNTDTNTNVGDNGGQQQGGFDFSQFGGGQQGGFDFSQFGGGQQGGFDMSQFGGGQQGGFDFSQFGGGQQGGFDMSQFGGGQQHGGNNTNTQQPNTNTNTNTNTTTQSTGTIKIMPIGDSITFGMGDTGGYRKFLYNSLKKKGYSVDMVGPEGTNSTTTNGLTYDDNHAGYSGFQIKQRASWGNDSSLYEKLKEKNAVKQAQPDIVLLIIGTNDMNANRSTSDCEKDLRDLLDYILADMPSGGMLFLGTIPELSGGMFGGGDKSSQIASYNAAIKKVAEEYKSSGKHVTFADVHGCLNGTADLGDGIHPNAEGYEKIGNLFSGLIDEYEKASAPAVTTTTTTTKATTTTTKATTTTTAATTTVPALKATKAGDANCDGKVDMSDVVLVMQALANPNKFALGGSDEKAITQQGEVNADVDKASEGLTPSDALTIQKFLLGMIKSL
ncbi:Lysophospholipase L1 [Ruminococcus flavefaciens]|uniref:endo-1,4-beta-xylanase n=2 Tax=Ruminococcus flavefaciens TaxID=1265 RepID=A0A1K1MKR8_RUMFL|nr:Lysophospholipase L1 [Ruminococcus flavefaciens]